MPDHCPWCQQAWSLTPAHQALRAQVDEGRMRFAMLECPACHLTLRYPAEPQKVPDAAGTLAPDAAIPKRCHTAGCGGYVVFIGDVTTAAYGCGECGQVWRSRDALDRA